MTWKHIEQSVTGTSHALIQKGCEDSVAASILLKDGEEIFIACMSDGAGSALYGAKASEYITTTSINILTQWTDAGKEIDKAETYELLEQLYIALKEEADTSNVPINEFSATVLGALVYADKAIFFQIGDGAIVYNDETGFYVPVFIPQNGEFLNTTSFLIDDATFPQLQFRLVSNSINEFAIFTDGLQQLALSTNDNSVHQPFFTTLFPSLRRAQEKVHIELLNQKLFSYLNSKLINERTDDDKTLLLASRLSL